MVTIVLIAMNLIGALIATVGGTAAIDMEKSSGHRRSGAVIIFAGFAICLATAIAIRVVR